MSTDAELVMQTIVDEGRKLLEEGDRLGAYSHFVIATQLHPDDEQLWMWRGETTDDPREAVECFERVMEINPDNHTAREKLVFVRLNNLQQEARVSKDSRAIKSTNPTAFSFPTLFVLFTAIFLLLSVLALGGLVLLWQFLPASAANQASGGELSTVASLSLPATWTPLPTRTPLPGFTPVSRPSWKISKDTIVRAGPSTAFEKLGTLPKDSEIYIIARSKDSKFLQIEFPDGARLAWIPSDSAQIESAELMALAIPTSVPTLPLAPKINVIVPTAKPVATPTSVFEFVTASPPRTSADCNRQTGVNGTVYSSLTNWQPVNGVIVRITAFGQLQNTIPTGSKGRAGYWEWYFTNNANIVGEIALINADGSLRSQPVSFQLTSCYGSNPGNQFIVDFAGTR